MKTTAFSFESDYTSLADMLLKKLRLFKTLPVILCIGSDRITGDCLGPLCGHLLVNIYNTPCYVYGTLNLPVTAQNLQTTLDFIKIRHPNQKIWAIDASIGNPEDIGTIKLTSGIYPGSFVGHKLPKAGSLGISACVASNSSNNFQTAKLGFVYKLADKIAQAVNKSIRVHISLQKIYNSASDNNIISAVN
ncbi:MAG TPA: spore protease YyaC [Clostridia bacterium]